MMKHKKYRIQGVLLILVFIMIGTAYYVYNKPHKDVFKSRTEIYIDADTLVSDFDKNEETANTIYLEKIIEVKGILKEHKIEQDQMILVLEGNHELANVICYLQANNESEIKLPVLGKQITVKGICTGYLMDVVLIKCSLLKQ